MTTDSRTNEPTEAQVEAAAKAIADCHNPGMFEKYPENWRVEARAALVAATRVPVHGGPTEDRKALQVAVGRVVRDVMNFPQGVQARLLGQDLTPLRDALVDSVEAAGFSRATVPDAATEERVKKIILESLVFTNENSDPWAQLLTENILAALDGAPEPDAGPEDDEYQARCGSWDCRAPECGRA